MTLAQDSPDVPPPPERLYTAEDLFAAWDPDDPMSAAATFDFATYATTRRQGSRVPATRQIAEARAAHDVAVSWLLAETLNDRFPVAIMGGHAMSRDETGYELIARLAHRLADTGYTILSGGGPGAMEAAHLGARCVGSKIGIDEALDIIRAGAGGGGGGKDQTSDDDGRLRFPFHNADVLFDAAGAVVPEEVERLHRWQAPAFELAVRTAGEAGPSIGIPTWLYGHEPPTPLATQHAKYFENSIREDGLLGVATAGVVFAPGKAGTLQEIFQDAAQNYYTTFGDRFSPMVFLDIDEYWTVEYNVRSVLERLFDDSQELNMAWVTTAEEAVDVLVAANPGLRSTRAQRSSG